MTLIWTRVLPCKVLFTNGSTAPSSKRATRWLGLEYRPSGDTDASLGFVEALGLRRA